MCQTFFHLLLVVVVALVVVVVVALVLVAAGEGDLEMVVAAEEEAVVPMVVEARTRCCLVRGDSSTGSAWSECVESTASSDGGRQRDSRVFGFHQ